MFLIQVYHIFENIHYPSQGKYVSMKTNKVLHRQGNTIMYMYRQSEPSVFSSPLYTKSQEVYM